MEKTTNEMNLLDLCMAAWNGLVSLCRKICGVIADMIKLTFRRWWIVLPILIALVVFAFWWYRPAHRAYKAEGVFVLNGPTLEQFEQRFQQLANANPQSEDNNLAALLGISKKTAGQMMDFRSFKMYDCNKDDMPDIIDYKHKVSPTDTLYQRLEDHVAIRFRYGRDITALQEVETALVKFFNSNPEFIAQYEAYKATLEREHKFCHEQIDKLDSMTTVLYMSNPNFSASNQNGIFSGDRRIQLPLRDIRKHIDHTYTVDQRLMQATAPVVLDNHLVLKGSPMHDTRKLAVVAILLGWIIGCLMALMVERRKDISAWLRK